jgi:hypothetical protein
VEEALFQKAQAYAALHQLRIGNPLGSGHHGSVFVAEGNVKPNRSAFKVHKEREPYFREKGVYERLTQKEVVAIEGFAVPQFLSADDDLLVLEMTIVEAPFIVDFASAYLDKPPEFPENVWEDWRHEKREEFGERWPVVEDILTTLRMQGVYLSDVHARNIAFLDET